MIRHAFETLDLLIARHVAGDLPAFARLLVDTHLAIKPQSRRIADGLEAMAGAALDAEIPIQLSGEPDRLASILASQVQAAPLADRPSPMTTDSVFPKPLHDFLGFGVESVPWRTKLPGFREYDLGERDGCEASLFWLRPGRKIPAHTHEGSELFLVLDGDFSDLRGRYGRGDIAIADDSVDHQPVAGMERPCIGLSVTDGALRLTGPMHRRLGDILGL